MSGVGLYHGTFAHLMPSILRDGLKPRGRSKSHDAYMDSASMPHFVYLTAVYALALEHACRISERTAGGSDVAVLEIDMKVLDADLLYPDEDYLAFEWNSDFVDWTIKEQLEFMEYHRDTWPESLETFATVAYKGVIPAAALSPCPVPRWMEREKRFKFRRAVSQ
jgi:hypothetical protein